jgi:hypothetical protein
MSATLVSATVTSGLPYDKVLNIYPWAAWGIGMFLGTFLPFILGWLSAVEEKLFFYLGVILTSGTFAALYGYAVRSAGGHIATLSFFPFAILLMMALALGLGVMTGE